MRVLFLILLLLIFPALPPPAGGVVDPPGSGNWVVSDVESGTVQDQSIVLTGNLSIYGSLVLQRVDLYFATPPPGQAPYWLWVHGGGRLTVLNSTIWNVLDTGNFTFKVYGRMVMEASTVTGTSSGVRIFSSDVRISGSTLNKGTTYGLYVKEAAPLIEDTTIEGNGDDGIYLHSAGPVLRRLIVTNNGGNGLFAKDGSAPLVEESAFTSNTGGGIYITNGSSPTVQRSVVRSNGDDGIFAVNGSAPVVDGSNISYNRGHGVRIWNRTGGLVSNSTMVGNGLDGASVNYDSMTAIRDSVMDGNGDDGLQVKNGSAVSLVRLTVRGNTNDSLFINNNATVFLEGSLLSSGGSNGVLAKDGARIEAYNTTITGHRDKGIHITQGANATLTNVTVLWSGDDGLYVNGSSPVVRSSVIRQNGKYGVHLLDSGAILRNNSFSNNTMDGLHARGGGPFLDGNRLSYNGDEGVQFFDARGAVLLNNTFVHNGKSGVKLTDSPVPVAANRLGHNLEWGLISRGAEAVLSADNIFSDTDGHPNDNGEVWHLWSLAVGVLDAMGRPVPAAGVDVVDRYGKVAWQPVTDANGTSTAYITGSKRYNSTSTVEPGPYTLLATRGSSKAGGNYSGKENGKVTITLSDLLLGSDVAVRNASLSSATPFAREPVVVKAELVNSGDLPAACAVDYYLDRQDPFHLLGSLDRTPVPTGAGVPIRFRWSAEPGNHTLLVSASGCEPRDTAPGNNTVTLPVSVQPAPARPDLLLLDDDVRVEGGVSGRRVNFSAVVYNVGLAGASADVRFLLDDPAAGREVGRVPGLRVEAGGTAVAGGWWDSGDTAGEHRLFAAASADSAEERDGNNIASTLFTLHPRTRENSPDLAVETILPSSEEPLEGEDVLLIVRVGNLGAVEARAELRLFTQNGSIATLPFLVAGNGTTNLSAIWKADTGRYNIRASVEGTSPREVGMENNRAGRNITVWSRGNLRLAGSSISISPARPRDGDTVVLNVSVENAGPRPVPPVTVHLLLDGLLLSNATPPIPRGETRSVNFSWKARAGRHILEVEVNPDRGVPESSLADNNATLSMKVSGRNTPAKSPGMETVLVLAALVMYRFTKYGRENKGPFGSLEWGGKRVGEGGPQAPPRRRRRFRTNHPFI